MSLSSTIPGIVSGSILVLAVWVVFRLVPRVSPDIRAWTWRIVLVKLALSAFAVGQISLHLLPVRGAVSKQSTVGSMPVVEREQPSEASIKFLATEQNRGPAKVVPLQKVPTMSASATNIEPGLLSIWSFVVMILLGNAFLMTRRTRRDLRNAIPVTNEDVLMCLRAMCLRSGLARAPRIVSMPNINGPMVYGIFRPVIVLPIRLSTELSEDVELALGHEIAHIKRGDVFWASFGWLVRVILFCDPIVWIAESELRASQESATDQEAVWITGASVAAYAKMLLSSMNPDRASWQNAGLAMFDSFRSSQRRLRAMHGFSSNPKPRRKWTVALLVLIGAGILPTYTLVPALAASQANSKSRGTSQPQLEQTDRKGSVEPLEKKQLRTYDRSNLLGTLRKSTLSRSIDKGLSNTKLSNLSRPEIKFVEENSSSRLSSTPPSSEFLEASKHALDDLNSRIADLISDQDERIAAYRVGADQREREAEQREREAQMRKRSSVQRARAALLREQVIAEEERTHYQFVGPDQRAVAAETRKADAQQAGADRYQAVLDQRQRETDAWQRKFDNETIASIRNATQADIASARDQYRKRIAELQADEKSLHHEIPVAAPSSDFQLKLHTIRAGSGLSFAIPDGYDVVRVQPAGKDTYTVVLKHKKN